MHGRPLTDARLDTMNKVLVGACILVIALVPLWSADIPPMLDYHNHLARQFILAQLPNSEILQQFYRVEWFARPYLAMDASVQWLARFVEIDTAGKIFLSVMLSLCALSPIALSLALFDRVTPMALLGLLCIHNTTVSLGFVNYVFAIGFALCLFALWIRYREGMGWVRLLAFPLLSTVLFFCHVLGFLVYALLISAYELGRHVEKLPRVEVRGLLSFDRTQRLNLLSFVLQFAVPLLVLLSFMPSRSSTGENTYGGAWRKIELLSGVIPYLIPPYSWTLDRLVWFAVGIGIVLLLVLRKIALPKAMWWPVGAMFLLFLATPMELSSGWGADHRMLVPLGLLVLGSLGMRAGAVRTRAWAYSIPFVALLVFTRAIGVAAEWRKTNADVYAEYLRAFETLTDGARLYFAFGHESGKKLWPSPAYHLPHLALMTKQVYVPYLFDGPGGIPLQYKPEFKALEGRSPGPVLLNRESPDWGTLIREYDFFLLANERFFRSPVPSELELVFEGRSVRMYKPRTGHGR